MLFFMIICLSIFVVILFLNKKHKFNIEYIIKYGTLKNKESLVGEVFYKGSTRGSHGDNSYLTYVRLNNGKDIIINQEDVYRRFNFCDKIPFSKYIYTHSYSTVLFYVIELDELDKIRLCTEIESI